MRNLKKLLAVVLVVVVMLSAMATVAFADNSTISADAQACATLSMLQGSGSGVTAAYTATQPTRIQAAILLLRLKGLEADAKAFTGTDNFSDVKAGWEKPYTAYLKAHPELGFGGVGSNKFAPDQKIDAKSYYKVMLTALGYVIPTDYTWDNTISFAASKGLAKANDAKTFTIDTLAVATVETLKANVKGSDKSLVAAMAEKDAAFAAKATAAGIYTADTTLKVASVNYVNGKTVTIVFSKPVTSATVLNGALLNANITIQNIAGAPFVTAASAAASLSDDRKTLTITPQTTEYFGGDYVITVGTGVTDDSNNAIKAYSAISTLKDTDRPTVAVSYPFNGVARFTFSEPVKVTDSAAMAALISVTAPSDGAAAGAPSATLAADKKSFDLDISGYTTGKSYTVTLVGVGDYAGNLITPNPCTATVINNTVDSVKPTVTAEAVDVDKVKLTFSEKLKTGHLGTVNGIAIAGNSTVDSTGLIYTVTAAGATPRLSGTALLTVAGFQDLSGNAGDTYTKLMNFVADTTAPSYVSSEVKAIGPTQYLLVKYDENVVKAAGLASTAIMTGTYVDSNSITKSFTAKTLGDTTLYMPTVGQTTTDTIQIDLSSLPSGIYSATISGAAVDGAGNAANSKTVSFSIGTFNDPTKPTVASITVQATEDAVTVVFSMDVTPATALNVSNYLVEGQSIFSGAIFNGDAHTVKLTLNPNVITIGGARNMTVQNVATAAGKVMDTSTVTKTFVENVKPYLASAKFTSGTAITATFSETLGAGSTNAFEVYVGGVKLTSGVTAVAATPGSKDVIITVPTIDLSKTYQIKFVGTDFVDQAIPGNKAPASGLITVTN
ncbi:MAG: hypothetical protein Q8920_02880 [Bacillota bacterium]|nr:hypothetical protein [Bacillota bacterium]